MEENNNRKENIFKKWWFWFILIFIAVAIVLAVLFIPKNEKNNNSIVEKIENIMLPEFNKTATASEKVLYDKNKVKITFKGITYDYSGANVNLEFENNNSEKIEFIAGSTGICKNAINEFMIKDAYSRTEVEPGKKETDKISFWYSSLNLYGIDEIAQIILTFSIDASDSSSNFEEKFTDPLIINTSLYNSYSFNNESRYINRITSKAVETKYNSKILQKDLTHYSIVDKLDILSMIRMENKDGKEMMLLETKNDTGRDLKIKLSNFKFNDKIIYEYDFNGSDDIISGKKAILDINLNNLKEKDAAKEFDKIEKISFKVSVLDLNYDEVTSREVSYQINSTIENSSSISTTEEKNTELTQEETNISSKIEEENTPASNDTSTTKTGISTEFKNAMDAYEKFINEYAEFMKKYKKNSSDPELASQYYTMSLEYSKQINAFQKWKTNEMTEEESDYYSKVQSRVSLKLLEAYK